jgi:hypothetical protein
MLGGAVIESKLRNRQFQGGYCNLYTVDLNAPKRAKS